MLLFIFFISMLIIKSEKRRNVNHPFSPTLLLEFFQCIHAELQCLFSRQTFSFHIVDIIVKQRSDSLGPFLILFFREAA